MSKQFKLIILINILLSLIYAVSSYLIWEEVNKWSNWNIVSVWTPIFINPYRIPDTPQVTMPINPIWNFPFILFWVIFTTNLYFIIRLQRNKEKTT
jgi:hypothetical protein